MRLRLSRYIESVIRPMVGDCGLNTPPKVVCETPKHRSLGDLSTNIAMQICKSVKGLDLLSTAEGIADSLRQGLKDSGIDDLISKIEVKRPGFINFYFSRRYLYSVINEINSRGGDFGRPEGVKAKMILIEFVSANPTGPLSVAHGRQAAIGDVLANILDFAGHEVDREYYLNDEGNQIMILGRSIHARYCELLGKPAAFPDNGYKGGYIYDIAKIFMDKYGRDMFEPNEKNISLFCDFGVSHIMEGIKKDLNDFGVAFDSYYSQRSLGRSGEIEKTLQELGQKGLLYEKDSALWFLSSRFGDDKDRVLRKSDGSYTYITPDIAYHKDKLQRGYDLLIDLLGPDHHGYINRMKAACQAMGKDPDILAILIIQLVTLSRRGVPVRMSTREGEFISLREVMDEAGRDATRFFFLTRRRDSHLDFDFDLAKKQSIENPVYYIQYAHARICGILNNKDKIGIVEDDDRDRLLSLLDSEEELEIMRLLREFPEAIKSCAISLEPHLLIAYLMELAASFHGFYARHRVVSDNADLSLARLMLIEALKKVFSIALALLGVSIPDRM
ncbi:MAG: arginine--tRNA ligase [Candidatus Omnitrophota bacterium]|jgi:arginyl-tRNA synthetase